LIFSTGWIGRNSGRQNGRQSVRQWPKTIKFAIWRLAVNLAANVAAMAGKLHIGHLAASRKLGLKRSV
jgi:hypothetical protein